MEKEVIDILNDLVRINIDRIRGYEKATEEIGGTFNGETKSLFADLAHQSALFKNELTSAVRRLDGEPAEDSTSSGKIYRLWMDVKAAFTAGSIKSVLDSCEFGEDAALKAYREALTQDVTWPEDVHALIVNQLELLQASHDKVKRLRNEYNAAESR